MAVTVFIPQKKKDSIYSAYIHGKVVNKYYEKDVGSLFRIEGTAVIFYTYSNYRRAYIFTEKEMNRDKLPLLEGNIPLVKQKIQLIYSAEGRRFDSLKFFIYRTHKEYGEEIFNYSMDFWLRVAALLDNYNPSRRNTKANKRNVDELIKTLKKNMRLTYESN